MLRLALAPLVFHGDVTVNYWWGNFAVDFGLKGYYDWLNFGGYAQPDQPMLYIYLYALVRLIYQFFYQIFWYLNVNIPLFPSNFMTWYFLYGNQFLEKIFPIFSDILLIYFTYRFITKTFNRNFGVIASSILAIYPPLIYNTALWGSNDSILNLLGLASIYFFFQRKYIIGTLLFTLCILFKSSLLIFSPIILIILYRNKISLSSLFLSFLVFLTVLLIITTPFAPYNQFIWVYHVYSEHILPGAMPQLTCNAFNFWSLIYGLKPQLDNLSVAGSLTARQISVLICLFAYLYILLKLSRTYSIKQVLLSLALTSLVTFTFLTRMHERYLFPSLIPLLILSFYSPRYIKYFTVLTLTFLLNNYNWWWYPYWPPLVSLLQHSLTIFIISSLNVFVTLKLLYEQI